MVACLENADKLVTRKPVRSESGILDAAYSSAQLSENLIACLMTVGVINQFEAVDVEYEECA